MGYNLQILFSYLKTLNLSCWTAILKNYCYIWNQHPRIHLIAKFRKKNNKNAWIWDQNALYGYFWVGMWKKYFQISNQCPWICLVAKFNVKIKILKFGTKDMRDLGISGLELENNIIIFEISALEFVWLWNFVKKWKWKCLNKERKMPYLGSFRLEFEKRYSHIWNRGPWISFVAKFAAKLKILKFETKTN